MPDSSKKLPVTTGASAKSLAETMFGDGITVVSASYRGDTAAAGVYTNGLKTSPDVVPADSGVILSTGRASDFTNASGGVNQESDTTTNTSGVDNDAQMNKIAGTNTYDGAFLDATFIPEGDTLTMRLVFASEEYLEWVDKGYNDAVGIWVNGVKATLTIGDGDISIDNINTSRNANLFRDNGKGAYNTEMDGVTHVLTLKAAVNPGQVNSIHIGIADAGDSAYDSALLIVADSVQTALIAKDDTVTVTARGEAHANLLANDLTKGRTGVVLSHVNDQAVKAGDTIILGSGEKLVIGAGGEITVHATDSLSPVTFNYTITDSTGTADTAFVTLLPSPVDGTSGNDSMMVGYRDKDGNIIDGADGLSEAILGYDGNDKIFAGLGDDAIYGGAGNDFVRAGAGNDLIDGGSGDDVLDGEAGADRMVGGTGNDVYYVDDAGDVVIEAANAGYDKLIASLSHVLEANVDELWLREGSAATDGTGNDLANKIVGNSLDNHLWGLGGADQIIALAGNDQVFGGAGNDLIFGGAGDDTLQGGDGNDKLFGDTGADLLIGGAGNDQIAAGSAGSTLTGGTGYDQLYGGAGADSFTFATGDGFDRVKHFALGFDRIELDGVDDAAVQVAVKSGVVTLTWGTSDKVVIRDIDWSHAAPEDLVHGITWDLLSLAI